MSDKPSHVVNRAETKAAKVADRQRVAAEVWSELEREQHKQDAKTERLKAPRRAREAETQA